MRPGPAEAGSGGRASVHTFYTTISNMQNGITPQADHYYHVYNRGVERRTLFLDRQDYGFFKSRLFRYAMANRTDILAYCIMPNHYHLLVHATEENALSKMIHRLQTSYAGYFNKRYNHSGYVFQGRYNAKEIRSTVYLAWLVCYIHLNPVDARLVSETEQWEHSSHIDFQKETNPLIQRKLIDIPYADILEEYLSRRQEKEKYISGYFLD